MLTQKDYGVMENAVAEAGISDEKLSLEPDRRFLLGRFSHTQSLEGRGGAVKGRAGDLLKL